MILDLTCENLLSTLIETAINCHKEVGEDRRLSLVILFNRSDRPGGETLERDNEVMST